VFDTRNTELDIQNRHTGRTTGVDGSKISYNNNTTTTTLECTECTDDKRAEQVISHSARKNQ
jgi:hypothetical protein